ncbi:MAG: septum formation initiator family protein [Candidatus Daviesbacteria bacterium]|nr:septum formation initiator family protein [Candidatus Daviesbacteria bacterium]
MIKKIAAVFILLIIGLFSYSLITRTTEAVKSGERLSKSADLVYKLEAQNKQLKKKLTEIKSPDYIEEAIRNKLGFARKGETIVVIPEEKLKLVLGASQSAQIRLPNWLGWLKVFF